MCVLRCVCVKVCSDVESAGDYIMNICVCVCVRASTCMLNPMPSCWSMRQRTCCKYSPIFSEILTCIHPHTRARTHTHTHTHIRCRETGTVVTQVTVEVSSYSKGQGVKRERTHTPPLLSYPLSVLNFSVCARVCVYVQKCAKRRSEEHTSELQSR